MMPPVARHWAMRRLRRAAHERRQARTAPPPPSNVLARIKHSGVLRVGMEPNAPPLHFINARKQEDGFDFQLAGVIAEALGAKRVQVVEADYEDLPARLLAGDVDILMAGYVPDPSIENVDWSIGYLDFGLCMIVHDTKAATLKARRISQASESRSTTIPRPSAGSRKTFPMLASGNSPETPAGSRQSRRTRWTR